MPVIAVGLAAVLDIGVIGGLATGIAVSTMSIITAVGATVSAVGAVTHNKTLSMIGMGIGIVGAIGTMASGAGIFDNVTDLWGKVTAPAGAAEIAAAAGPLDVAGIGAAADAGLASADAALTSTFGGINAASSVAAAEGMVPGPMASAVSHGTSVSAFEAPDGTGASAVGGMSKATPQMSVPNPSGVNLDAVPTPTESGLMAFANKNPVIAMGAMQGGFSLIGGLFDKVPAGQVDNLESQAELNRAQAALIKRQTENSAAPLPTGTVSSPAVTGTNILGGGMINKVGAPLITGAPNTGSVATQQVTGIA